MKRYPDKIKKQAIQAVKKGASYNQTAKDFGADIDTIVRWCKKAGVVSQQSKEYRRCSDDEIIKTLHDFHALTGSELSHILHYSAIAFSGRLRRMLCDRKINCVVLSGSTKGGIKHRGLFRGYVDRKLYYIDKDGLSKWIRDHIPHNPPKGLKRAITRKLRSAGIDIDLFPKPSNHPVVIDSILYNKIKTVAEKEDMPIKEIIDDAINKELKRRK